MIYKANILYLFFQSGYYLMYKTLLHLTSTSPNVPLLTPSTHSSVLSIFILNIILLHANSYIDRCSLKLPLIPIPTSI